MTQTEKAYLDGLYAAALICMDIAKQRNSVYASAIMRYRMTKQLTIEDKNMGCKKGTGKKPVKK